VIFVQSTDDFSRSTVNCHATAADPGNLATPVCRSHVTKVIQPHNEKRHPFVVRVAPVCSKAVLAVVLNRPSRPARDRTGGRLTTVVTDDAAKGMNRPGFGPARFRRQRAGDAGDPSYRTDSVASPGSAGERTGGSRGSGIDTADEADWLIELGYLPVPEQSARAKTKTMIAIHQQYSGRSLRYVRATGRVGELREQLQRLLHPGRALGGPPEPAATTERQRRRRRRPCIPFPSVREQRREHSVNAYKQGGPDPAGDRSVLSSTAWKEPARQQV
jgi:hypothetical protein